MITPRGVVTILGRSQAPKVLDSSWARAWSTRWWSRPGELTVATRRARASLLLILTIFPLLVFVVIGILLFREPLDCVSMCTNLPPAGRIHHRGSPAKLKKVLSRFRNNTQGLVLSW